MVADTSVQCETFEDRYARTPRRRLLGRGAFGSVFKVVPKDDPTQQYVAKEIQVTSLTAQERNDALSEVQLLRALSHPNVVTCVDAMLKGGALYIVMEYATGGDMSQKIRAQKELTQRFPERTVMGTFAQLAKALQFVHHRRILHRDLKPANIFVFGSGELGTCTVKLGDFGLGKMFESTTFEALSVVGSPSYFSPEVCDGRPYGRKADVWSLGAVLYELTCLEVPFVGRTILAVALLVCKSQAKPIPDEYSESLQSLVDQMLQKKPTERPGLKAVCQDPYVMQFLPTVSDSCEQLSVSETFPESVASGYSSREDSRDLSGGLKLATQIEEDNCVFADVIEAAFKEHNLTKQGTVRPDVLGELLQIVVPGFSKENVAEVLASAGLSGEESVEISTFLDWLCQ